MAHIKLQRGLGLALWRQIANHIRLDVLNGEYGDAGKIPREIDLATKYSVNRHTVRRAISELTAEGLLTAQRGQGTFVSAPKLSYPVSENTRFHEIVAGQSRIPHGTLIASKIEPANDEIAQALNCSNGNQIWHLETVYSADRKPVSTASMWFNHSRFKNLPGDFQKSGSLSEALKDGGVATYSRKQTFIQARMANSVEISRLELNPHSAVLVTQYISYDSTGMPFQYSKTSFAAERVQLIAGG